MDTQSTENQALAALLEADFCEIGGQLVLSQGRGVDMLLDLFNATTDEAVRGTICGCLNEIRSVNLVRGADLRAALLLVAALSVGEPEFAEAC